MLSKSYLYFTQPFTDLPGKKLRFSLTSLPFFYVSPFIICVDLYPVNKIFLFLLLLFLLLCLGGEGEAGKKKDRRIEIRIESLIPI